MDFDSTSNRVWLILIIVISILVLCVFLLTSIDKREKPVIQIHNFQPCGQVEFTKVNEEEYKTYKLLSVCADVDTDTFPLRLTLFIEPLDNLTHSYGSDAQVDSKKNTVTFFINDLIEPGRYRARIKYARDTLATIYIEVIRK